MTAGRGIVHSEMPVVTSGDLWGFQLWYESHCRALELPCAAVFVQLTISHLRILDTVNPI